MTFLLVKGCYKITWDCITITFTIIRIVGCLGKILLMTVYIDNVLIKMWVDETQACVFTRIKAAPLKQNDLDDLNRQIAIAVKKLMKRHAHVFSITDMTLCDNWSATDMHVVMMLAAKEYKMGVTHKFFIRPQDTQA